MWRVWRVWGVWIVWAVGLGSARLHRDGAQPGGRLRHLRLVVVGFALLAPSSLRPVGAAAAARRRNRRTLCRANAAAPTAPTAPAAERGRDALCRGRGRPVSTHGGGSARG